MTGSVKVEGGPELASTLRKLGKTLGRNILRRVGRKRLEPMRDVAKALAPKGFGDLAEGIIVGTRLAKSQRKARGVHVGGGSFRAAAKDHVTVHVGPGQHPQAIQQEFGNFRHPAQPYMRPAFDQEAGKVIPGIGDDLWSEINKAVARAERKAKRLLAAGRK